MDGRGRSQYTPQQWQRAEALVIEGRLTLEAAADAVGIPVGTLKRRAAEQRWCELRDGLLEYRPNVQKLKAKALKLALEEPTPEHIAAWASVERTYPEKTYGDQALRREVVLSVFDGFAAWVAQRGLGEGFLSELESLIVGYVDTVKE